MEIKIIETENVIQGTALIIQGTALISENQETKFYIVKLSKQEFHPEIVVFKKPSKLIEWAKDNSVLAAVTGGFYINRTDGEKGVPLGNLYLEGIKQDSVPFDSPWNQTRGCFISDKANQEISISSFEDIDLSPNSIKQKSILQAGPILIQNRKIVNSKREGFSSGKGQFDSDITLGRYPRSAIAYNKDHLMLFACDGYSTTSAGLTMSELAEVLLYFESEQALNLDGGGSTSLFFHNRLLNEPSHPEGYERLDKTGRPISSAIFIRKAYQ